MVCLSGRLLPWWQLAFVTDRFCHSTGQPLNESAETNMPVPRTCYPFYGCFNLFSGPGLALYQDLNVSMSHINSPCPWHSLLTLNTLCSAVLSTWLPSGLSDGTERATPQLGLQVGHRTKHMTATHTCKTITACVHSMCMMDSCVIAGHPLQREASSQGIQLVQLVA